MNYIFDNYENKFNHNFETINIHHENGRKL